MNLGVHDAVEAALRVVTQRYTPGRRALVDVMSSASAPVPLAALVKKSRQPQSSVYRNLSVLETAGVVRRITGREDAFLYELSEKLTEHHHHVVCVKCGTVSDADLGAAAERALHRAAEEVGADSGFIIDSHSVDFYGYCRKCQS